jgi:hypothetical protein
MEIKRREVNGLIEAVKKFGNIPILITYDQEMEIDGVRTIPAWKWLLQ